MANLPEFVSGSLAGTAAGRDAAGGVAAGGVARVKSAAGKLAGGAGSARLTTSLPPWRVTGGDAWLGLPGLGTGRKREYCGPIEADGAAS